MVLNLLAIATTLLLLGSTPLQAASINWTTSVVSGPSDVSTNGILIGALNAGGNFPNTLNGVTFAPDPGGLGTLLLGTATVVFTFDDSFNNGMWAGSSPGGSADYNELLDYSRQSDATLSGTVTLGALVVGATYEVQLWIVDTRPCCNNRTRTVDGVLTHGNNLNIARGIFTADATTQVISIAGDESGYGPQLNLLQLRALSLPQSPIVWTTSVVSDPSDVSTNGTLVGALNVGGTFERTLNGVAFGSDPGGFGSIPLGTATVAFTFDESFNNGMWSGPSPGGSADYNELLDYSRQSDAANSGNVILGSLVPGRVYAVQLWIVDTRPCCNNRTRTVDGVVTHGRDLNIALGTFTADTTTKAITISGVPAATDRN